MDEQATRPKPRSYTEDYKRQVVDLVASSGRTPTAVAGEVGLHPTLLLAPLPLPAQLWMVDELLAAHGIAVSHG